jgi:beta-galactosidase
MTLLPAIVLLAGCASGNSWRRGEDFNFDWKFTLGDDIAFAEPDYDDSGWRDLHLPHDWSVEGEFSAENPSTPGGGALPGGIGWYRKHFFVPEGCFEPKPLADKVVRVEFDGVFMNSTVFVNGMAVGTRPYGYSSFAYDISALVVPGDNVIAVRCDNADQPNSRWYAGCGIYRNVRLVVTDRVRVAYNGVYVSTPEITSDAAKVHVSVRTENELPGQQVRYDVRIADRSGRTVATTSAIGGYAFDTDLTVHDPRRWDLSDPYLYTAWVTVSAGKLKDVVATRFGIRSTAWDADRGFILNGRPVKMLGVCLHHDMGCLGAAVHPRALQRELQILKDMGVNAIRTSHNPPAPELLDLCDEMGFLVMDEAMDMWRKRKTRYDYARFFDEWHVRDVQDFVRRDRNHPSVVMWSIGNEILEQSDSRDDDIANLTPEQANDLLNFIHSLGQSDPSENNPNILLTRHMADLIRELDTTRAVTAGCNGVWPGNNLLRSGALDVYGFNYHPQLYDSCRVWFPGKPLLGSETVSSLNSRGVYFQPSTDKVKLPSRGWQYTAEGEVDWDHQVTAYDACCAPWANYHEEAWIAVRDRDFIAGTFIWTGFDYLGEPTPYGWPSRSSYFGVVDLAGFPKDAYWLYRSEWTDETVLHLFPHWNWEKGEPVDVWAYYNNADEVELFVNGESWGRQSKTHDVLHVQWNAVPFEPGRIEVVSYRNGKEVARDARYTAGAPVTLRLTPDRTTIAADGYDLSYVTVEALDADGRVVPTATDLLHFSVAGDGELAGVDNGNAADTLSLKGSDKALFSGKALAVIRSRRGQRGVATLSVSAPYATVKTNIIVK